MCSMCFICKACSEAKNWIAQSYQVHFYLQRILVLLKMEVYLVKNAIKIKKFCLLLQAKNVEHFLSVGQIYLNMANILHECNRNMSAISAMMLRVMDIYSKLKIHLLDEESKNDRIADEEFSCDEETLEIPFDIELEEELDFNEFDEFYEDEFCADIIEIYFDELYYRKFLLANIEMLITQIKSLCVAFTGSCSTLYIVLYLTLTDYCEKVKLFLHDDTTITESWQKRSPRSVRHKYDLLEQLLARISKEQEYVAKYVTIKLKKESGKSNN